jgi:hypothetical protein
LFPANICERKKEEAYVKERRGEEKPAEANHIFLSSLVWHHRSPPFSFVPSAAHLYRALPGSLIFNLYDSNPIGATYLMIDVMAGDPSLYKN